MEWAHAALAVVALTVGTGADTILGAGTFAVAGTTVRVLALDMDERRNGSKESKVSLRLASAGLVDWGLWCASAVYPRGPTMSNVQ